MAASESATGPGEDGPQSCYFWDIRKGECHFEMLVLDCTPCAACPARPARIGGTDDDE